MSDSPVQETPSPSSLADYVSAEMLRDVPSGVFALVAPDLLSVEVNGRLRARSEALVAGSGRLAVTPASRFGSLAAKDASGGVLAGIDGRGRVFLADGGKQITLLGLRPDETLGLAPHAMLALEDSVSITALPVRLPSSKPAEWHAVILRGPGRIAFVSRGAPHMIRVTQDRPVFVRPGLAVAWSAGLSVSGLSGSTDARLAFMGTGFVFIQSGS